MPEGSTSIRSGLSALQQSPRKMSSQLEHSNSGSRRQEMRIGGSIHRDVGNVPETIVEDQSKMTSAGNSGGEKNVATPGRSQLPTSVSTTREKVGPNVNRINYREPGDEIFPSSTRSRPMGKNSVSKRVDKVTKNVLSKTSHRQNASPMARRVPVQQDSASLFSSVDDDASEDIFQGLEDDNGSKIAKRMVDTPSPVAEQRVADDEGHNPAQRAFFDTKRSIEKKQKKDSRKDSTKSKTKSSRGQRSTSNNNSSSLVEDPRTSPAIARRSSPLKESKLKSPVSRSNSGRKSRSTSRRSSRRTPSSERRDPLPSEKKEFIDLSKHNDPTVTNLEQTKIGSDFVNQGAEAEKSDNVFASLSCGLTEHCSDVIARMCLTEKKTEEEIPANHIDDDLEKSSLSGNSSADLTALEKKVWTEWDRLNENIDVRATTDDAHTEKADDEKKKKEQKSKREQAQEELLEIASMAMNQNLSESVQKRDDAKDEKASVFTEPIMSASVSSDSKSSSASGSSDTNSYSDSGYSGSSSFSNETGNESESASDIVSKDPLTSSTPTNGTRRGGVPPSPTDTASALVLSSSQRHLMEKFSKKLSSDGIEVLKLNTKGKWQIRYLTVSKELIPLSAHKAVSKSQDDLAYCHKALLWLKKFNHHHKDGYGISNIDKNGHGGMLLVDLSEIKVTSNNVLKQDDSIPKKLQEPFKDSVLVTMEYKINGSHRSIELRCKNDDDAQFLCTCTRLIRDLLRREKSLRQKSKSSLLLKSSSKKS